MITAVYARCSALEMLEFHGLLFRTLMEALSRGGMGKLRREQFKKARIGPRPFTFDIAAKIDNSEEKKVLSKWSKETYGNIFVKIATLEDIAKTKEDQVVINPTLSNNEELARAELLRKYICIQIWV
ncbi:hypothetical protein H5410_059427 [Solanum commersonii]|uniref:Uncharacterized protein n=1 Tax=Solanum commersonii TaxID=4109 RepID=A0A9J5W2F0_SOLCO|nr:hypothetical protein H5410_059427 [Solanum commersonii]